MVTPAPREMYLADLLALFKQMRRALHEVEELAEERGDAELADVARRGLEWRGSRD